MQHSIVCHLVHLPMYHIQIQDSPSNGKQQDLLCKDQFAFVAECGFIKSATPIAGLKCNMKLVSHWLKPVMKFPLSNTIYVYQVRLSDSLLSASRCL